MKITVSYTGQMKSAVGRAHEEVGIDPPCTLLGLIRRLARDHPEAARHFLNETGDVQRALLLVINNEQIPAGDDPRLADGDQIAIMPPISGGRAE